LKRDSIGRKHKVRGKASSDSLNFKIIILGGFPKLIQRWGTISIRTGNKNVRTLCIVSHDGTYSESEKPRKTAKKSKKGRKLREWSAS